MIKFAELRFLHFSKINTVFTHQSKPFFIPSARILFFDCISWDFESTINRACSYRAARGLGLDKGRDVKLARVNSTTRAAGSES